MMRLLTIVAVGFTFIFATLMFLIPPLAPETSVLSYTVPAPDRQEAIWLMDIRSGLSYSTGITYRNGNYPQWTPDGKSISVINFFTTPTTLDIVYFDGRAPQSFPIQTNQLGANLSQDGTKALYRSAAADGSLIIVDLITGEETTLVSDLPVIAGRWMNDGEHIIVNANSEGRFASTAPNSLYRVDANTGDVETLFENFTSSFSVMTDEPFQLIYVWERGLYIAQVGDTPEEARLITTFDAPTVRSLYLHPTHDNQVIVALSNQGTQEVWSVDINTGERELLHEFETSESLLLTLLYSPDGNTMVKLVEWSAQSSIFTLSQAGQPDYDITLQGEYQWLRWSPDGRYLVIYTNLNATDNFYLVDVADHSVTLLDVSLFPWLMWQPTTD